MTSETKLIQAVESHLLKHGTSDASVLHVLDLVRTHLDCVTGTIHRLNRQTGLLELLAHRGIPPVIMDTQLVREYDWCLKQLTQRRLGSTGP